MGTKQYLRGVPNDSPGWRYFRDRWEYQNGKEEWKMENDRPCDTEPEEEAKEPADLAEILERARKLLTDEDGFILEPADPWTYDVEDCATPHIMERQRQAREIQIGGGHYLGAVQPYEYCLAHNLTLPEGNVIKYVTRWRKKDGIEALKKARHTLDWLIEWAESVDEDEWRR